VTINGHNAERFLDDTINMLKKVKNGELKNAPYSIDEEILSKVKSQIYDQKTEPLSKKWKPLDLDTILRKKRIEREVGLKLRMKPETKWVMFGPLLDAINILPTSRGSISEIGIKQDKLYPYIRHVYIKNKKGKKTGRTRQIRVMDYAKYVERKRPLFSVFWKYYAKWMLEKLLKKMNAMATASVIGAPIEMFST